MLTQNKTTLYPRQKQKEPAPWDANPSGFFKNTRNRLPYNAMAVGVFDTKQPRVDEILAADGWSQDNLLKWCDSGFKKDLLFQSGKRQGFAIATTKDQAGEGALPGYKHMLVHMLPESLAARRWWWMVIARQKQKFSLLEQQIAGMMIRQCQARFNRISEDHAGRMLIGQDGRLIHADPWTNTLLLTHPKMLDELLEVLQPIATQRWNDHYDQANRDFAIQLCGKPYWICFHSRHTTKSVSHNYWYLELRPLEKDELPTIGCLDDDRIAQSLAFIHDHHQQSPSLSQISRAVNVSPFHFHRLFMKHIGISPKQYLQRKQMQMAKWMLRCSRISIGNIASQAGFASHGHFTSTFHRMVGMSPSQYRDTN